MKNENLEIAFVKTWCWLSSRCFQVKDRSDQKTKRNTSIRHKNDRIKTFCSRWRLCAASPAPRAPPRGETCWWRGSAGLSPVARSSGSTRIRYFLFLFLGPALRRKRRRRHFESSACKAHNEQDRRETGELKRPQYGAMLEKLVHVVPEWVGKQRQSEQFWFVPELIFFSSFFSFFKLLFFHLQFFRFVNCQEPVTAGRRRRYSALWQ